MSTFADVVLSIPPIGDTHFNGAGTQYLVQTPGMVLYQLCIDDNLDAAMRKSLDGGLSWSPVTSLFTGSVSHIAVWYDRWSGISAGLIHVAYCDATAADVVYRNIDTENSDTLSAQTVIFAGASDAVGCTISIVRTRGGNLLCAGQIDAGVEIYCARSVDVGANWTSRGAVMESATQDQIILLPGWGADNQDAIAIYWDASADEISRKVYDDSANSWAETSISTSMVDTLATNSTPHFAAAVDLINNQNILVAWSAVETINADLRCWKVTEAAITEVTNVVLNSGGEQGLCAIAVDINTNYWHAFYAGKSDGSENWNAAAGTFIYRKISQDQGVTWSSEIKYTAYRTNIIWMAPAPQFVGPPILTWFNQIDPQRVMMTASSVGRPKSRSFISVGL